MTSITEAEWLKARDEAEGNADAIPGALTAIELRQLWGDTDRHTRKLIQRLRDQGRIQATWKWDRRSDGVRIKKPAYVLVPRTDTETNSNSRIESDKAQNSSMQSGQAVPAGGNKKKAQK
jgi:hypothetical protein